MSAETDLLPLPEKSEIDRHLPTGVRVYGYTANDIKTYARANIAQATAARDAEIEALRAEVQFLRSHRPIARKLAQAEARAERLEEALREIAKPLDCGCRPCRGYCRQGAWEWMQEVAANALMHEQKNDDIGD